MTTPPPELSGFPVLWFTSIDNRHTPTSGCRHFLRNELAEPACGLVICKDSGEAVYLFYCDENWIPFTDTWHESIDHAKAQAEFEYRGVSSTWHQVDRY